MRHSVCYKVKPQHVNDKNYPPTVKMCWVSVIIQDPTQLHQQLHMIYCIWAQLFRAFNRLNSTIIPREAQLN